MARLYVGNAIAAAFDFTALNAGVGVWVRRPHIAQKSFGGATILKTINCVPRSSIESTLSAVKFELPKLIAGSGDSLATHDNAEETEDIVCSPHEDDSCASGVTHDDNNDGLTVIVRRLFPKLTERYSPYHEAVIIDRQGKEISFVYLPMPVDATAVTDSHSSQACKAEYRCPRVARYGMQLVEKSSGTPQATSDSHGSGDAATDHRGEELRVWVEDPDAFATENAVEDARDFKGMDWFVGKAIPKIVAWAEGHTETEARLSRPWMRFESLVDPEAYARRYSELKSKYGASLVNGWPEVTDPQKFVFEDIAISAYLLCLWDDERRQTGRQDLQSFVDLGCGNGLLVHILSLEGHRGRGIDVRARKIWSHFGPGTALEAFPFLPTEGTFPDTDWIIGNHSDELTPWIAYIAGKSSENCKFFVLPCCFFEFFGKFNRNDSRIGQYRTYLDYVRWVGEECGFVVESDAMRIPSTKRICQVGRKRSYAPEDAATAALRREAALSSSVNVHSKPKDGEGDVFSVRASVEPVRNCTRIDPSMKKAIVKAIVSVLVDREPAHLPNQRPIWRKGGTMHLSEGSAVLTPDMLAAMKCEFGGLQTLLRNHRHIFVVDKGCVSLRDYREEGYGDAAGPRKRQKTKNAAKAARDAQAVPAKHPCWFHFNHPDGCALSADACGHDHERAEP